MWLSDEPRYGLRFRKGECREEISAPQPCVQGVVGYTATSAESKILILRGVCR